MLNRVLFLIRKKFSVMIFDSNQKQTYCLGKRHVSETINKVVYEKTLKLKNLLNLSEVFAVFVLKTNHELSLSKW